MFVIDSHNVQLTVNELPYDHLFASVCGRLFFESI